MNKEGLKPEEIRGALARGYCTERNKRKALDSNLVEDMAVEIEKLFLPPQPIEVVEEILEKIEITKDGDGYHKLKEYHIRFNGKEIGGKEKLAQSIHQLLKDRKKPDFEYFLHEYYTEKVDPTCLDDDLPDCAADWISDLDCEEFINLGNLYAKKYQPELPRLEEKAVAKFLFDRCKNEKTLEWDMLTAQSQMPYRTEAKAICSKFATPKIDVELVGALESARKVLHMIEWSADNTTEVVEQALSNYKAALSRREETTKVRLPSENDLTNMILDTYWSHHKRADSHAPAMIMAKKIRALCKHSLEEQGIKTE